MEELAYGYIDNRGYIRNITWSKSNAILNARLNGHDEIVHIQSVDGAVPGNGAVILKHEKF